MSDTQKTRYAIDDINCRYLMGWAVHPAGIDSVRISVDGKYAGNAAVGLPRVDVGAAFPDISDASNSGFTFLFDESLWVNPLCDVQMEICSKDGNTMTVCRNAIPSFVMSMDEAVFSPECETPAFVPLPWGVVKALRRLRPQLYRADAWRLDVLGQAIRDVADLYSARFSIASVQHWVMYLRSMWQRFNEIQRQWVRFNEFRPPHAKDGVGIATCPAEMLSIANHLYLLRSYNVPGEFAEFGCFKGFSSSCLSLACNELGIPMHIFDSFEGLPNSGSSYYNEGDYCGSFEEVSSNIATFGRLDSVTFHRGFFSESIATFSVPLLCLWMDVDLYSSAADLAPAFKLLDRRSCIFSHEFPVDAAKSGKFLPDVPNGIITDDATKVLIAIASAFEQMKRPLTAAHMSNLTGALWETGVGIPAASKSVLEPLLS